MAATAIPREITPDRDRQFAPLQILPEQYLRSGREVAAMGPAYHLMAAVLADAVHNYRKLRPLRGRAGRKLRREIECWFVSEDAQWLFSFRNICDVLGLDRGAIRRQLALDLPPGMLS